jgi:hypothetical protein
MNITYTIARYDKLNSDVFLVAFNVTNEVGDSFYIESPLNLSDISAKTTVEVCQLAYDKIKPKIEEVLARLETQKNSKIGYQFIPE